MKKQMIHHLWSGPIIALLSQVSLLKAAELKKLKGMEILRMQSWSLKACQHGLAFQGAQTSLEGSAWGLRLSGNFYNPLVSPLTLEGFWGSGQSFLFIFKSFSKLRFSLAVDLKNVGFWGVKLEKLPFVRPWLTQASFAQHFLSVGAAEQPKAELAANINQISIESRETDLVPSSETETQLTVALPEHAIAAILEPIRKQQNEAIRIRKRNSENTLKNLRLENFLRGLQKSAYLFRNLLELQMKHLQCVYEFIESETSIKSDESTKNALFLSSLGNFYPLDAPQVYPLSQARLTEAFQEVIDYPKNKLSLALWVKASRASEIFSEEEQKDIFESDFLVQFEEGKFNLPQVLKNKPIQNALIFINAVRELGFQTIEKTLEASQKAELNFENWMDLAVDNILFKLRENLKFVSEEDMIQKLEQELQESQASLLNQLRPCTDENSSNESDSDEEASSTHSHPKACARSSAADFQPSQIQGNIQFFEKGFAEKLEARKAALKKNLI